MNAVIIHSLRFTDLYARALAQLPARFDLTNEPGAAGGYRVESLDVIDEAAESWIGSPHEVLMGNLFDAIYQAVHAGAAQNATIRMRDLSQDEVRAILHHRLRTTPPEAGWRAEDHALVRRYFDANTQPA